MNTTTGNRNCFSPGHDNIVEHVYGIIDSKFQFIKYQTDKLIQSHLEYLYHQEPDLDKRLRKIEKLDSTGEREAKVFRFIEEYSKTTKLLLFLRNCLSDKNAKIIFALLTDDTFLHFSEKEIKIIVEGKANRNAY